VTVSTLDKSAYESCHSDNVAETHDGNGYDEIFVPQILMAEELGDES
jgi:hypothetical protein